MRKKEIFKIIIGSIGIIAPVSFLYYQSLKGKKNDALFFNTAIHCLIKSQDNWQKRSVDFILENGLKINLAEPIGNRLEIGDSISKNEKSYQYKVYRKNYSGFYELRAERDFWDGLH